MIVVLDIPLSSNSKTLIDNNKKKLTSGQSGGGNITLKHKDTVKYSENFTWKTTDPSPETAKRL